MLTRCDTHMHVHVRCFTRAIARPLLATLELILICFLTGALSGALYRAPRGLRTAGVAGGIGAVAASALVYARNNLSKGL